MNYLEAYNLEIGLLINFGAKRLQFHRLTNKKYNPLIVQHPIQSEFIPFIPVQTMKKILQYLFEHKTLSREMATRKFLVNIGKGVYNEHEVTAFMTVYLMRSITIEELQGFREALLELCVPVDLNGYDAIDIVGTGGDGKNTFNISTLSCFIVAGTGQKVAKHGNYGASSISGASNVMEQVGYKFKNDKDKLKKEVDEANICFLHAPIVSSRVKNCRTDQEEPGNENFFNMLGPMVNPATPKFQLVGVFSLEMARIYNYLLQQTESAFTIIHGLDGYDEISSDQRHQGHHK